MLELNWDDFIRYPTSDMTVVRILKQAVENGVQKDVEIEHIEKVTDLLGKHRVFD